MCIRDRSDSMYLRCPSAYMVSNASDDLPEPESPVKTTNSSLGMSRQIMEWMKDYDEAEPGHRHISHLWALHPAFQITPYVTNNIDICKVLMSFQKLKIIETGDDISVPLVLMKRD